MIPVTGAGIPVTGAGLVPLLCGEDTQLNALAVVPYDTQNDILNYVIIPPLEPCKCKAVVQLETVDTLPNALPEGYKFIDGLSVTVYIGDQAIDLLPDNKKMEIVFAHWKEIPLSGKVILWWDPVGGLWREISTDSLSALSNPTGLFVLATK